MLGRSMRTKRSAELTATAKATMASLLSEKRWSDQKTPILSQKTFRTSDTAAAANISTTDVAEYTTTPRDRATRLLSLGVTNMQMYARQADAIHWGIRKRKS